MVEQICAEYHWTVSQVLDEHTMKELYALMGARERRIERMNRQSGQQSSPQSTNRVRPQSAQDFQQLMGSFPVEVDNG